MFSVGLQEKTRALYEGLATFENQGLQRYCDPHLTRSHSGLEEKNMTSPEGSTSQVLLQDQHSESLQRNTFTMSSTVSFVIETIYFI